MEEGWELVEELLSVGVVPSGMKVPLEFQVPERVVKVGLLAQAPVGNGGLRVYEHLSIQPITVKNIRAGK